MSTDGRSDQSPGSPKPSFSPRNARDGSEALTRRAEGIYRALRELFQDVLGRNSRAEALDKEARLVIDTELGVARSPGRSGQGERARRFADDLLSKLYMLAQECSVGETPFPLGKVYCHWCGSFDCAHSEPPESRAVFKEYSPTGQPIWLELGALALEKHHPDIHAFYGERPKPITLLEEGEELTSKQLSVHGKNSGIYRVLGQVVVGYLPMARGRSEQDRIALTIQAVETHQGRLRCHLNVIGVLPDGRTAAPFLQEVTDLRLSDALAAARGKLAELSLIAGAPTPVGSKGSEVAGDLSTTAGAGDGAKGASGAKKAGSGRKRRRRGGFKSRQRQAMKVLRRLWRNLDRIYRQRQRRTHHAEARHRDRERPASTALRDALKASSQSIYRDVEQGTWIVIGPRSRVHVFNDSGRHVTSVVYPGETIRNRTTQGRWRSGKDEDLQRFRAHLHRLMEDRS